MYKITITLNRVCRHKFKKTPRIEKERERKREREAMATTKHQ